MINLSEDVALKFSLLETFFLRSAEDPISGDLGNCKWLKINKYQVGFVLCGRAWVLNGSLWCSCVLKQGLSRGSRSFLVQEEAS